MKKKKDLARALAQFDTENMDLEEMEQFILRILEEQYLLTTYENLLLEAHDKCPEIFIGDTKI